LNQVVPKPLPMYLNPMLKEIIDSTLNNIVDKAWEDISMYDKYADELWKWAWVLKGWEPV